MRRSPGMRRQSAGRGERWSAARARHAPPPTLHSAMACGGGRMLPGSERCRRARQARWQAAILELAGTLVACAEATHWFHHDPIRELGGWTAAELVRMQRGPQVVAFLRSVRRGERG